HVHSLLIDSPLPVFFFLLIPRQPTSTLFPYTTLFRSYHLWLFDSLCWHPDNRTVYCLGNRGIMRQVLRVDTLTREVFPLTDAPRSEEHTSELQSRGHLVCRLLLEKKNNEIQRVLGERA